MKLTYDPKYNVAYIKLHEKTDEVTTIKISDEINIDIGSDGTAYGIELLNANTQLGEDQGNQRDRFLDQLQLTIRCVASIAVDHGYYA